MSAVRDLGHLGHLQRLIGDLKARLRDEVIGLALRGRGLEPGEVRRIDRAIAEWLAPLADEARALAVAARAAAAVGDCEPDHDDTNDRTNDEEIDDAPNEELETVHP